MGCLKKPRLFRQPILIMPISLRWFIVRLLLLTQQALRQNARLVLMCCPPICIAAMRSGPC